MKITLKGLECLIKIIETGSFTEAAKELNLAQPTLSTHIAMLEKNIGTRLLEREKGGISATQAGKIIYQKAIDIFKTLENTANEISDLKGLKSGSLTIAGSTIPGTYIIPEIIRKFKLKYPLIHINLYIKDSARVVEDIQNARADLGLVGSLPPAQFYHHQVAQDKIIVAVNADHHWFNKKKISLEQLLEEPLLTREPGSGTHKFFLDAIRKKTKKKPKTYSMVNTSEAMKTSILLGLAPGVISNLAVQRELTERTIHEVGVEGLILKRPFYLLVKNIQNVTQAAGTFIDYF